MIQDAQILLRTTLAASAAFQSLVGAGNAAGAEARIYHDSFPRPLSGGVAHTLAEITALRPCAIVYTEDFITAADSMGDQSCWHQEGILHAIIFRNVPLADKDNPSKVDVDFRVIMGDIIQDLIELSQTAGYLTSRKFRPIGPHRTANEDLNAIGDAQAYELQIEWGVRG